MRDVLVGWTKSIQDVEGELIEINGSVHKSKRVDVLLEIFHIIIDNMIALLWISKVLEMSHDSAT